MSDEYALAEVRRYAQLVRDINVLAYADRNPAAVIKGLRERLAEFDKESIEQAQRVVANGEH